MRSCLYKLGRPTLLAAVLAVAAHTAPADTARFYDEGLTKPLLRNQALIRIHPQTPLRPYKIADTGRFYDDGLTIHSFAPSAQSKTPNQLQVMKDI